MIKILCVISAVGITLGGTRAALPQAKDSGTIASDLLTAVMTVLEDSGRSGSLVYRGDCTRSEGMTDSFKVAAPEHHVSAIQALHHAFANEPAVTAREDASGLIRVVGGNVQTDLLELSIHQLVFRAEADPRDATYKVLALPEVKAYMQAHNIRFIPIVDGLIPPSQGVRLNETLKDVTVSQALDRIVQAFPGVWIYGECATPQGERLVYVLVHEFSRQPSSR